MNSNYFREEHRYSFNEIKQKLSILNNGACEDIINRLKACGILKVVRLTPNKLTLNDIDEEYDEIILDEVDSNNIRYVFKFVGVITVKNYVIICYPKYIKSRSEPIDEMKQVLKVIKKYNSKDQVINLYNGDQGEKSFNFLVIMLSLVNDYYNNGLYSNHQDIIELNGEGEILWDKTINETYALISNNRPYYLDFYTKIVVEDDTDYFTNLHKIILTECSKKLENLNVTSLFDMESVILSDFELDELGDIDYILYRLERELNTQFITQKQIVLKTLYAYLANRNSSQLDLSISLYGTNSFNLVWEKTCAFIFDNRLTTRLDKLPVKLVEKYKAQEGKTLSELIEKPIWTRYNNNGSKSEYRASKTLTPDLISIFKMEGKSSYGFWIFDAKYYNIDFYNSSVCNNPGVEDVTKEYLYQLAYKDFIDSHGYIFMQNIFLFPSELNEVQVIGQAKMDMLSNLSKDMKDIELIKLPANKIYDMYLNDIVYDIFIIEQAIKENRKGINGDESKEITSVVTDVISKQCFNREIEEKDIVGLIN